MIFIHGQAASGKYTIGRRLADDLGLALFHNHLTVDLVSSLFEFGSEPFVELREKVWLAAFDEAARAGVSFVFTFQPEATVRPVFIERTVATVKGHGGEVVFVELECPEEVVEQRIGDESRAKFGKLRSLDFYRELRDSGAFDFPPMPEPAIRVPTHELAPEESVALIRRYLIAGTAG